VYRWLRGSCARLRCYRGYRWDDKSWQYLCGLHVSQPTPFVLALRSFTARTGAKLGAAGAIAYLGGGMAFEMAFGRPNADQGPGLMGAFVILGVGFAAVGAFAGFLVQSVVRRTRHAGPADRRYVTAALAVVVVTSVIFGIQAVRRFEERSRPRVQQSTGSIARIEGRTSLTRLVPAVTIFKPFGNMSTPPLMWENAKLVVALVNGTLTVRRGDRQVDAVDVSGLDYVSEVSATTGTLDGAAQWLAVLVSLRATGHRELLLIYDPDGALVHKELLESSPNYPHSGYPLRTAGERGARQEFLLDVGEPLRFIAKK
jgi:hypothetical protein